MVILAIINDEYIITICGTPGANRIAAKTILVLARQPGCFGSSGKVRGVCY